MHSFFKRLPLFGKLLIIALVPIIFIGYLTLQLYHEKTDNVNQLKFFINGMDQSATITRLIDQLQKEGKASFDYALTKQNQTEILRQRPVTDSLLENLQSNHDRSLKDFTSYTFLNKLDSVRNLIDNNRCSTNTIVNYYSSAIFRLNTLNRPSFLNNHILEKAFGEISFQRLLSEIITYQSIINTNVYNVLFTKQYQTETLLGTFGTYQVYKTYEKELKVKADSSFLQLFDSLRNYSDYTIVDNYLAKLFTGFKFDSSFTYQAWNKVSSRSLNQLRHLQALVLENIEKKVNEYYVQEQTAKTKTILYLIIIAFILVLVVSYIVMIINSSLISLKKAALKIANGATNIQLKSVSNDAIGILAASINRIDEKNIELAAAAQQIGNGNFEITVKPRSSEDVLGNALVQMKENLQRFTTDLKNSREEFKKLADFMPQIVWTATPDGKVDYYNEKWYEITGAKKSFGQESFIPVLHPEDVGAVLTAWYRSVETGIPYETEYRLKNSTTNSYRWFLGRAVPVKDEDGKIIKWFATATDIHDQKLQNEKLEEIVAQRTLELKRSNDDLQQFAHVASHDLKEPVRKLITFSDRLSTEYSDAIPEKGKTYLDKLQNSSKRMAKMIDSILKYSVVNAADEIKEVVDLNLVIEDIINDLELLIVQKEATVRYHHLPKIKAMPALMYQLFYNLINNALKFSKQNQPCIITIFSAKLNSSEVKKFPALQKTNAYTEIIVSDNGIGFNPEFADKMFNVFTRLNSREKYEGTGLGLALCKKIVHRHQGIIYAEGEEGVGSTFHILLPENPVNS